jgi:pimeloyl-ACP methyl ester carboxylesterase
MKRARDRVEQFKVSVPEEKLAWLKTRLRDARWPQTLAGTGWYYGPDAVAFRSLIEYWRDGYDWRAQEAHINRLPQFSVLVEGQRLHFVHMRSANPKAVPLLLLHGWPNTFYSFDKVIEPLAAPERFGDDFRHGCHVIVPSLPGFGFSQPCSHGIGSPRFIAQRIYHLMSEVLGYRRFVVDGGDWGGLIADWLAVDQPHALIAQRSSVFILGRVMSETPTTEELAYAEKEAAIMRREGAYHLLQATRPETIAYAMTDSPVGIAAYLVDKWQKWTDTRSRGVEEIIGREHLLSEIMLYVVSESFPTSIWIYAGYAIEGTSIPKTLKMSVPYGYVGYPDPLGDCPPRHLVERVRNVISWEIKPTGGHFPYLEDPGGYVSGLRAFVDGLAVGEA